MSSHIRDALVVVGALLAGSLSWAGDYPSLPFDMYDGDHANLVLSVSDAEKTHEFYGEVLGLERLPDIDFPGDTYMIRYLGGNSEIKFIYSGQPMPRQTGGVGEAIGVRRMTLVFPVPKRDTILDGLLTHGYEQTDYRVIHVPDEGQVHIAKVRDFDDNEVRLLFVGPESSRNTEEEFEIAMTVSDRDEMYGFLKNVLKLKSRTRLANKVYSFQAGSTRLNILEAEGDVPVYVGRPGEAVGMRLIQFLVQDVHKVREDIVRHGGTIHTEPFPLADLATIMFVEGPDGILFEFAGPQLPSESDTSD